MEKPEAPISSKILAKITYFADLEPPVMQKLSSAAIQRKYDAGQVVFMEGEPCSGLYVVQDGWLKSVMIAASGREQVIRVVGPGDVFNELGVLAGGLNQITVQALEPATLWIIPQNVLLELMRRDPGLCQAIVRNLTQRIQHLMKLVEDLSLRPVEGRLARILLEAAQEGVINRRRWSTQAEMAARLGTVPDVLNRALRSLVEEGVIRLERQQIVILDPAALKARARLDDIKA
jgi:CRP/FNR family transcriptional regulator